MKEYGIRDGAGEGMLALGKNKEVVVLAADLMVSTRASYFAEKYPKRSYQVGICEQNMACVAAGMASVGKVPFINSFAVFSPGRNWEQIRTSVCYSNLNVKIHASHAGITVGGDGATHEALEDIAITRALPNMVVLVPCDKREAKKAILEAYKYKGPVYIRTSRAKVPNVTTEKAPFRIGKASKMRTGRDVTIVACGIMVNEALIAAKQLKDSNINAEVINCSTIKPLDGKTILESVEKTKCVVTAEEHQINGGLGSAVSELLVKNNPRPVEMVAVQDTYGESGGAKELQEKYGLTSKEIIAAAKTAIKRKIRAML